MNKIIVYPCDFLGVKTLVFPEQPWTITGQECGCWDKDSGHGACTPGIRNIAEVLAEEDALALVQEYKRWYLNEEDEIEIAYDWQEAYDTTRLEKAIEYASRIAKEL